MSRRMKFISAALGLVVILTGVFASMAFAADPTSGQDLPACCQQKPVTSAVAGCCGQQGNAVTGLSAGSCCGR